MAARLSNDEHKLAARTVASHTHKFSLSLIWPLKGRMHYTQSEAGARARAMSNILFNVAAICLRLFFATIHLQKYRASWKKY
jgi:hypothetical protein